MLHALAGPNRKGPQLLVPQQFEVPALGVLGRIASRLLQVEAPQLVAGHACCAAQHPAAAAGADLLVAVANEDQFAGTLAVTIMEHHARLRAEEPRCPVVRVVSGARSLLSDPLGRVRTHRQGLPTVVSMLRVTPPYTQKALP